MASILERSADGAGTPGAAPSERSKAATPTPWVPLVPSPRLVLFDLDDTLCDYEAAREARLRRAFSLDSRIAHDAGRLDAMVEDSILMEPHGADHFPRLFAVYGVDESSVAEVARSWYRQHRFFGLRLFADARETLSAVRRGRRADGGEFRATIGLVTNGPAEIQRDKIRLLGLDAQIDFAVVSGELGVWKPDPAIFDAALERGGVPAKDAVFVGDSARYDIAGAHAARIRSIWVDRAERGWDVRLRPPDRTVANLRQIPPLLGLRNGTR